MAPFNLHICYGLVLILNHCACFQIRDIPESNRARRYDPYSADPEPDSYYQDSGWYKAAKRLAGGDTYQGDSKPFLDLANLKDILKLRFDEYDQQDVLPEDYPEEAQVSYDPTQSQSGTDDVPEEANSVDDPEKQSRDLRYRVLLDTKGDFKLEWDIDDVLEMVYFRLVAKVAKNDVLMFGFSDYGEITSADVMVMWTNQTGRHVVQDAHTDSEGKLHVDESQDYILDDVNIQDGGLSLTFHRKYDTCDDDDYLIDTGTTHMIFLTTPGISGDIENLDLSNVKVGVQRVQIIKSQLPDSEIPDDTQEFVMHVDKVQIPEDETTYWMAVRKLPDLKEKHHIIKDVYCDFNCDFYCNFYYDFYCNFYCDFYYDVYYDFYYDFHYDFYYDVYYDVYYDFHYDFYNDVYYDFYYDFYCNFHCDFYYDVYSDLYCDF
ncbi:hypothetical protein LSH36_194g01003 [Paralvinella palmiformis]|uniref:DOMON domain-containing protein n=1 Tax=Paralvinella palmiformis TaxID=53620 RepID=A0AAD9JQE4_9ANNE|nr:hypothetical protein LSH36_194g01003 [Paralvinella palmiformis]